MHISITSMVAYNQLILCICVSPILQTYSPYSLNTLKNLDDWLLPHIHICTLHVYVLSAYPQNSHSSAFLILVDQLYTHILNCINDLLYSLSLLYIYCTTLFAYSSSHFILPYILPLLYALHYTILVTHSLFTQ